MAGSRSAAACRSTVRLAAGEGFPPATALGAPGFAATFEELLGPAAVRSAPSFDCRGADDPDFAGAADDFPLRAVDLDAIEPV
jgi:hypothetical protein